MNLLKSLWKILCIFSYTLGLLIWALFHMDQIEDLKLVWAKKMLRFLNVEVEVKGLPSDLETLIFVGNHVSYVDIPLLMSSVRGVVFVAKKEVKDIPIIGQGAKLVGTVLVDRSSAESRAHVREQMKKILAHTKKRIAIFPAGTTTLYETVPWKKGAFEIALDSQISMQVFRIKYEPLRLTAYIDDDQLHTHLFDLLCGEGIKASIEFGEVFQVADPIREADSRQVWVKS